MTSTLQKWVLIIDIPKTIYKLQELNYRHFRADFTDDTRRVHLKAWKDVKPNNKLICEGSPTEECQHGNFNNSNALELHQRALKHGKYARSIGE